MSLGKDKLIVAGLSLTANNKDMKMQRLMDVLLFCFFKNIV